MFLGISLAANSPYEGVAIVERYLQNNKLFHEVHQTEQRLARQHTNEVIFYPVPFETHAQEHELLALPKLNLTCAVDISRALRDYSQVHFVFSANKMS